MYFAMSWQKKIAKIFSVFFLMLALFACDNDGCVEADEFDNQYSKVDSRPYQDGIFGNYNHTDGGQTAEWHSTGFT